MPTMRNDFGERLSRKQRKMVTVPGYGKFKWRDHMRRYLRWDKLKRPWMHDGRKLSDMARPDGPYYKAEKQQAPRVQNHFTYKEGPMLFLGQQIVRAMQQAGYPSEVYYCYRSGELQNSLYAQGRTVPGPNATSDRPLGDRVTNARAFESPHQYFEAVDIVHVALKWDASDDYWKTLGRCARVVEEKFGVTFRYGSDWGDMAHIELRDWRDFKAQVGNERPSTSQLWARFRAVLPNVAKQHMKSAAYSKSASN